MFPPISESNTSDDERGDEHETCRPNERPIVRKSEPNCRSGELARAQRTRIADCRSNSAHAAERTRSIRPQGRRGSIARTSSR